MTINYSASVISCRTNFAAYNPNQIARLAGMFTLTLHFGIWQAMQAVALNQEPASFSQRIEVALMSEAPKQSSSSMESKPQLPAIAEAEIFQSVAIPLPVSDAMPIVKPLAKPIQKISKTPVREKNTSSLAKLEKHSSPKASDNTSETGGVGSAGGYGVASQTGQGIAGGIGLGGGTGSGAATGTGSEKDRADDSDADAYTEANFKANYATNPKPLYPEAAKSRGWTGTVLLRVQVTAEGFSEQITVHRSSGHNLLDDSAIVAVQKWRFIPAKRGNTAVSCTVIVPVVFTLN